jgi:outer membrane lipoprotein SlyB
VLNALCHYHKDERGANTYSSTETGQLSSVLEGNIVAIKQVQLSGSKGMGSGIGHVTSSASHD